MQKAEKMYHKLRKCGKNWESVVKTERESVQKNWESMQKAKRDSDLSVKWQTFFGVDK